MLPADLDDEERAHLAHEHPNDLDSSPSSPSSSAPTFYENRRRPKSAARHRAHATADGSTSSHLLARLVSREEEVREINAALVVTTERLEGESSRANAAERRALDYFHRLRIATDNRERAEQESARLREELKLYKLQLENAQKEIFRAQDIIDQVAAQRNEAEAEAARARTKARKLQEEKLVMLAREEGRRVGYKEGLSMGRRIGYEEHDDNGDDENVLELGEDPNDEERNDPRPHAQLRSSASTRSQPMRSESVPPVRTIETPSPPPPLPVPSRVVPVHVHTPSHEHRTPRELDEPETIHPIPIRPSPILSSQPISVPLDDGWIPRVDSRTSRIELPSPHRLQQPVPPSPGPIPAEFQERRTTPQPESTPVPPPVRARDYAYQTSVPPPIPLGHTPSLVSRTSTHISQYDLLNKRPGSSLRNEIYVGRPRSGSQRSRESASRNEHRGQDRRHSSRTEAETIVEQWRADSDDGSPAPRNPSRSFTPAPVPHPYRPPNFYYRPRDTATPSGDDDPRSRTPGPTVPTTTRPPPPADDPESNSTRARTPLEYFRKRFRQRPSSGGSGSIPNIIVESPSEPETAISPSATAAAQPELLSPEAANRPLPQDDAGRQQQQQQHHHHHHPPHTHAHGQPYAQSHPAPSRSHSHQHASSSSSHDAPSRSGTPYASWPAGFVPYPPGVHTTSSSSNSRSGAERDPRRAYVHGYPVPSSSPTPSNAHRYPAPGSETGAGRPREGYVRARTQSASTAVGRGGYEAAPLPPGVTYPAPPVRPHTSHRPYHDADRGQERARAREGRDWDWERERTRDREGGRWREEARDYYERERGKDPEDTGLDEELTHSPAPLQRPISLFDSDEA